MHVPDVFTRGGGGGAITMEEATVSLSMPLWLIAMRINELIIVDNSCSVVHR